MPEVASPSRRVIPRFHRYPVEFSPANRMLRVRELCDAAGVMLVSGVRVRVWCLDAVAFYRRYGRRTHQWHRQMMVADDGRWVLDKRPQFGGAAAHREQVEHRTSVNRKEDSTHLPTRSRARSARSRATRTRWRLSCATSHGRL